jgi:hypothetical protein
MEQITIFGTKISDAVKISERPILYCLVEFPKYRTRTLLKLLFLDFYSVGATMTNNVYCILFVIRSCSGIHRPR